jgi:uncharacterized protein YndB with AHSA1/START domain
MSGRTTNAEVTRYELEIPIDAPREEVWTALTEGIDDWWLPDFHMVGEGSKVTFDARAGGHLMETREDGASLLWCTVHMCTPGESIRMYGFASPEWGGPATSLLHFALQERDGGTLFVVQDARHGHVSPENIQSLVDGWTLLFTDGLKKHVEAS